MPSFDFSEIVEQRVPMEPGSYSAMVTKVEEAESSNGKPKLVVSFESTHEGTVGKTFRGSVFLTPKALFNLFDLLRCTGLFTYGDFGDGKNVDVDYQDLVGCETGCIVEAYKTSSGDMSSSVKGFCTIDRCVGQTGSLSDMHEVEEESTGLGSLVS